MYDIGDVQVVPGGNTVGGKYAVDKDGSRLFMRNSGIVQRHNERRHARHARTRRIL